MEKFVQKFRRAVKESGYKWRLSVEEFKQGMNGVIKKKLIETKRFSRSIKKKIKDKSFDSKDKYTSKCWWGIKTMIALAVRVEDNKLYLFYFLFYFIFFIYFLF